MFQIEDAWIHASQTALARLCGRPTVQRLPFVEMPNWGTIFVVEFVPADDRVDGISRRFAVSETEYLLHFCNDPTMLDLRVWAFGFDSSPVESPMKEVVEIFKAIDESGAVYFLVFDDGASATDSPWFENELPVQEYECMWRQPGFAN